MMLILILWAVLGIPLAVLTAALFFAARWIPSGAVRALTPLAAGIIFIVASMSMEPPLPGNSEALRFLVGIFTHPLLFLPPFIVLQKYLHRIPVIYAVFFAALISSCVLILSGALQGDQHYVELDVIQFFVRATLTLVEDVIIASGAFGLMIMLDIVVTGPEEKNP
jgi:hypothetical protein